MLPNFCKRFLLLSLPAVFLFCQSASAETSGKASWYSSECCKYNPVKSCPMANGESLYAAERAGEDFAASWQYPLGSILRVTNLQNNKSIKVTVKDRGPAKRLRRLIDLSKKSFSEIADLKTGIINVNVEVLK